MRSSFYLALAVFASLSARAENTDTDSDLAKQLANPVASLTTVPFQSNFDFGIGPNDATRFTLNFQPVLPVSLNDDWNLIVRTMSNLSCPSTFAEFFISSSILWQSFTHFPSIK